MAVPGILLGGGFTTGAEQLSLGSKFACSAVGIMHGHSQTVLYSEHASLYILSSFLEEFHSLPSASCSLFSFINELAK